MKNSKSFLFLLFTIWVMLMFLVPGNVMATGDPDYDPPLGALGPPPVPGDIWPYMVDGKSNVFPSPMKPIQELGYLTLFDPKLSGDQSSPCTACHDPEQGWGTNEPISKGYPGTVHWRNSQSVANIAYLEHLFWGGSTPSLESQAPSAARAGRAGNMADDTGEARLRMSPVYVKMFNEVFGTRWPQIEDAWRAMAAYERYLSQTDTPFDLYMRGDKNAISAAAKRGLDLFKGKANCFECHNGPYLTDQKYYNNGVPRNEQFLDEGLRQINLRWEMYGNKGNEEKVYRFLKDDAGLWFRGKAWEDRGKFRTHTIRFTKYTGPFTHQGNLFTLEELVDFYDEGGGENDFTKPSKNPWGGMSKGTKTPILKPLNLTDQEKEDLVEFILTTSGVDMKMPIPPSPKMLPMGDWQPRK